jgi:hypothetical protein
MQNDTGQPLTFLICRPRGGWLLIYERRQVWTDQQHQKIKCGVQLDAEELPQDDFLGDMVTLYPTRVCKTDGLNTLRQEIVDS